MRQRHFGVGNLPLAELSFVKKESTSPDLYPRQPANLRRKPGYRPDHTDGKEFQKYQPVWTAAGLSALVCGAACGWDRAGSA